MKLEKRHINILAVLAQYGTFSPIQQGRREVCRQLVEGGIIKGNARERNRNGTKLYSEREVYVFTPKGRALFREASRAEKRKPKKAKAK